MTQIGCIFFILDARIKAALNQPEIDSKQLVAVGVYRNNRCTDWYVDSNLLDNLLNASGNSFLTIPEFIKHGLVSTHSDFYGFLKKGSSGQIFEYSDLLNYEEKAAETFLLDNSNLSNLNSE
jgi:hypothetical protein